jgi:hypothetical protein
MKPNVPNTKVARRRKGRKSNTTKNEVARFAGDAYDLGRRALQGVSYLKNLINIELKSVDDTDNRAAGTTASIEMVCPLAQGLDNGNRIGDSIKLQKLTFSATFYRHSSATSSSVRVILFRDNRCAGGLPAFTDIFQFNDASMLHQPLKQYALDTERFGILVDTIVDLSVSNYRQTNVYTIPHTGHIKYIGTDGTIASHAAGSLFLLTWSTENTNKPEVDWYLRVLYTDD